METGRVGSWGDPSVLSSSSSPAGLGVRGLVVGDGVVIPHIICIGPTGMYSESVDRVRGM